MFTRFGCLLAVAQFGLNSVFAQFFKLLELIGSGGGVIPYAVVVGLGKKVRVCV